MNDENLEPPRPFAVDAMIVGDASMLEHPYFVEQGCIRGTRHTTDVSYQRPVSVDGPEPTRW